MVKSSDRQFFHIYPKSIFFNELYLMKRVIFRCFLLIQIRYSMKKLYSKKKYFTYFFINLFLIPGLTVFTQYEKNPLIDIITGDYLMTIEKFVQIPDDNDKRPRINYMTFLGDRFFASTEGGKIYEISNNTDITALLFFDVKKAIPLNTGRQLFATNNWHSGLRSFVFHPDFETNGKLYMSVMEERPSDVSGHHYVSDVEDPIDADGAVIEWTYNFDTKSIDSNSYREVLRVGVPALDHTIKQISFNRFAQTGDEDYGLLYISHGDGNPYFAPGEGGQNNDARGKILRINPLQTETLPYSIPESNPFVNDPDWIDEIFAIGLRNSHTLSFAKDDSGKVSLISGNAGHEQIEEINIIKKGENYGWSDREGTYIHLPNGDLEPLPENEAGLGYTYPAAQWSRTDAVFSGFNAFSIAGGYAYTVESTGEKIFISGDFPQSGYIMYNNLNELTSSITKLDAANTEIDQPEELTQAAFKLFDIYFDNDGDSLTPADNKTSMLDIINDEPAFDMSNRSDIRFGQDMYENIYISSKRNGWIYKVQSISAKPVNNITQTELSKNVFEDIYPNPVGKSKILNITLSDPVGNDTYISLTGIDGKIITTQKIPYGEKKVLIDFNQIGVQPGYYFLQISGSLAAITPIIVY